MPRFDHLRSLEPGQWAIHHLLHEDNAPQVCAGAVIEFAVELDMTARWLHGDVPDPPTVTPRDAFGYEVISTIVGGSVSLGNFRASYTHSDPSLDGLPVRFRGRLSLMDWDERGRASDEAPASLVRRWRVEHLLTRGENRWRDQGGFVEVRDTSSRRGEDAGGCFVLICTLA